MSHQFEAFKELLQRYRIVWQNAWARRHEMDAPRRQPHELQFLPAALALQEKPVSLTASLPCQPITTAGKKTKQL